MIGLDDYRVLWTDPDGDRLCVDAEGWTMSDGSRSVEAVYLPTDHDDKVTVAAAFVDALGLEPCEGGFRAKPRPFQVGDVVGVWRGSAFTVLHVGSERLFVVAEDAHEYAIEHHRCTLITPAEEVEQGEEAADAAATEQAEPVEHRRCHDEDGAGNRCTLTVGHDGLHASVGVLSGTTWARWSA
jgi:hypothetical protein